MKRTLNGTKWARKHNQYNYVPLSADVKGDVVTLCMERKDHVVDTLLTMEKLWEEYQVYSKDDMDSINERMAIKEDVDE